MPKKMHLKLRTSYFTKSHALGLTVFVFLAILSESPLGYFAENMIAQQTTFKIRSILQMEPTFDSQIKVISFDDKTLDFVGAEDLSLDAWGKLLGEISAAKPRLILVNKHFGLVKDQSPPTTLAGLNTLLETRTIAGSYLDSRILQSGNALNLDRDEYNLAKMMNQSGYGVQAINRISWMPLTSGTLIGPDKRLAADFKYIGHIQTEDFGYIQPFVRINQKLAVPHLSLFAGSKVSISPKKLLINGKEVYLNKNNFIVPNTLSTKTISLRSTSLQSFIKDPAIPSRTPNNFIKQGDIVIILPKMYQTNSDGVDASLQRQQAGYVIVSMVNSILQKNWLRPINLGLPLLAFACIFGYFLATTCRKDKFKVSMLGSLAAIFIFSISTFCLLGWMIPWLFPTVGTALCGTLIFARRSAINSRQLALLKNSLHGRIPPEKIESLCEHPHLLQSTPVSKITTVMFVNIVDFSQLAEGQAPEKSFAVLSELFTLVRNVVLARGGIVDRTIGDSMLVYFGYSPDGKHRALEHADDALTCAFKIREMVLALNEIKSAKGEAIYPIRIGINTSSVYVGNIGDEGHLDFAVIGHGVNIAKRLESACGDYCITLGASTFDLLVHRQELSASVVKRFVPSPGDEAMLEIYECDPFIDSQTTAGDVAGAHRKSQSGNLTDERWPVPDDIQIMFASGYGPAHLVDFSRSGFAVTLEKCLGAGVLLDFSLIFDQSNFTYSNEFTIKIQGEVRWARPAQGGFLHGILIKNLSPEERDQLFNHFKTRVEVASDLIFDN